VLERAQLTAIDVNNGALHVAGLRRKEKCDDVRDFFGASEPGDAERACHLCDCSGFVKTLRLRNSLDSRLQALGCDRTCDIPFTLNEGKVSLVAAVKLFRKAQLIPMEDYSPWNNRPFSQRRGWG
jgi:hypothetical protein